MDAQPQTQEQRQPQLPQQPQPQQIAQKVEPKPQHVQPHAHAPPHVQHPQPAHHAEPKANKWKERKERLKEFIKECKRVLTVTKKPDAEELKTIVKISGVGILLIGLIGFLIHFAREGLRAAGV